MAIKTNKRAYLNRFKTPIHTLGGKYTPTALALLEFVDTHNIQLDRWILAQAELIKKEFFNLYMCYGEPALDRYEAWEARQGNKYLRKVDREKQTDSTLQDIAHSIQRGHVAAISWIPQLQKIEPPSLAAALFFLLPNLQGWYALSYETFRTEVMESGLCDQKHMVAWWGKYKRSKLIQETCAKALVDAQNIHGKLEW
jgi:hypothetical protein